MSLEATTEETVVVNEADTEAASTEVNAGEVSTAEASTVEANIQRESTIRLVNITRVVVISGLANEQNAEEVTDSKIAVDKDPEVGTEEANIAEENTEAAVETEEAGEETSPGLSTDPAPIEAVEM